MKSCCSPWGSQVWLSGGGGEVCQKGGRRGGEKCIFSIFYWNVATRAAEGCEVGAGDVCVCVATMMLLKNRNIEVWLGMQMLGSYM